jgi:hypothetical protein
MSLQRCSLADGTQGWKWGNSGLGRLTKREALRDGVTAMSKGPLYHAFIAAGVRTPDEARSILEKSDSSENLSKGETTMSGFRIFAQIQKVDAEKRLVIGRAVQEMVDKDNEVFDYAKSKPNFQKWSAEISKDTDGKSLGNVRAMHGKVAAGKLTEIDFNDGAKAIDVCAKIVDDNEWKKVMEGVYTGFSIGGRYVGDKVAEKMAGKDVMRYVADPSEISLVDRPCIPTAKFFDVVKHDAGGKEIHLMKVAFIEKQFEDARAVINENVTLAQEDAAVGVAVSGEKKGPKSVAAENITDPLKRPSINNSITEVAAAEDQKRKDKKTERGDLDNEADETNDDNVDVAVTGPIADKAKVGEDTSVKADKGEKEEKEYRVEGTEEEIDALAKVMSEAKLTTGLVLKIVQDAVSFSKADEIRQYMMPMSAEEFAKYVGEHQDEIKVITHIAKREFSTDERGKMADKGQAMPDGSFPIANKEDLKNAIQAHGRAKDPEKAKAHIKTRAKALGATDQLPDDWKGGEKMLDASNIRKMMKDGLVKGLYDVAQLVSVVQSLYALCQNAWYEKKSEGDDSMVPDALKKNVEGLVETLKEMVDEETAELLGAIDPAEKVDAMNLFTRLAKVGARNSKDDMGRIQKVHDLTNELGAACGGMADKLHDEKGALGLDKASGNAFEKAITSAVAKATSGIREELTKAQETIKKLSDMPAPSTVVLRAVGKGHDFGSGDTKIGGDKEVTPVMKDGKVDDSATAIKKLHASGGTTILSVGNK